MFLTQIVHDFNFNINARMDEIVYKLKFKKSKTRFFFPLLKSKISFHSNQGRNTSLLWHKSILSSVKNYTFVVDDVVVFSWKQGSNMIQYRYLKHADDELIRYWLLHTFLPLYYVLENMYEMLHVGAIELEGRACLFAAPSFGGKSTLTHYFLEKGHNLLSDDKLAILKRDDHYYASPSYPYARNYRNLEDLGKHIKNFSTKALPVGCVYRLIQVDKEESISIREVKGIEKFAIVEMCNDIKLSMLKKEKFSQLHDMAKKTSIYEITVPQNFDSLEDVYEKIVEHFNLLS